MIVKDVMSQSQFRLTEQINFTNKIGGKVEGIVMTSTSILLSSFPHLHSK